MGEPPVNYNLVEGAAASQEAATGTLNQAAEGCLRRANL